LDILTKYFPDLSPIQLKQFAQLEELYTFWNAQINVISRKDTENFYTHHVLHSLGIAKVCAFKPESSVLDIGSPKPQNPYIMKIYITNKQENIL
jgi:16S rRNA (guanine527-N7)-methyltransferase